VLFPKKPSTFGRCQEEFQTGGWKGYRVILGANSKNDSGSVSGLVVFRNDYDVASFDLFACLCVGR
jgi:hypothetical protein